MKNDITDILARLAFVACTLLLVYSVFFNPDEMQNKSMETQKEQQIDIELREMELKVDTILMNLRKFNKEIDSLNKEIEKWQ